MAAASTIDHVPYRAFFLKRDGPLDYEFPSCHECQTGSRIEELVISAIARIAPNMTEDNANELDKLFAGFACNNPEAFEELFGPERLSGLVLPRGVQARLHRPNGWTIMNIGERLHKYLESYATKLAKALYYKHASTFVPAKAEIKIRMVTNADIGTPQELLLSGFIFPETPMLVRCTNKQAGQPLTAQFDYAYQIDDKTRNAAFQVRFYRSILFVALVIVVPFE